MTARPHTVHDPEPAGWRGAVVVALLALGVYANTLANGFTYDDRPVILHNPATDPQAPWWEAWRQPWWTMGQWAGDSDRPYRPLAVQIFAWERRLWGDHPAPFHALNILLHAANSAGLWYLARRLGCSRRIALGMGALFAVHPLNTEAVANIVGRAELLTLGGMLAAVILTDMLVRGAASRRRPMLYPALILAVAVAVFSKERGALLIVLLPAWCVWASRSQGLRPDRRWLIVALIPTAVVAVYLLLRVQVSGTLLFLGQRYGPDNVLRQASGAERWLTPFALLGRYLQLFVWPQRLLCNYAVDVLRPAGSLLNGHVMLGLGFVIATLAACVRASARRGRLVLLAVCFAATYFPASNSVVLVETLFAERWFYGPAVWLCVGLGVLFSGIRKDFVPAGSRAGLTVLCGGLLLLGFAVRTVLRNRVWMSNDVLFAHDLSEMQPGRRSAHLCCLVGRQRYASGDLEGARALLLEAVEIYPDYPEYHHELGKIALAMGDTAAAIRRLERAYALQRRSTATRLLLAQAQARADGVDLLGRLAESRRQARESPDDVGAVRAWARLAEQVDLTEAVGAYRRLVELAPDDPEARNGLAFALSQSGRIAEAVTLYRHVVQRRPDNWEAHSNLATLLMDAGAPQRFDPQAAIHHARRAVALNPTHWQLRANLAEVLANCGRPTEAADLFEALAAEAPADSQERRLCLERARALGDGQ